MSKYLQKLIDDYIVSHPELDIPIVQIKNPRSGCYIAINRVAGTIIGSSCGGQSFKNIPIIINKPKEADE